MKRIVLAITGIITLFILIAVAFISFFESGDKENDMIRNKFAYQIRTEVLAYYKDKGSFPESLGTLPIANNTDFIRLYQNKEIRYASGVSNKKPWYRLSGEAITRGMECVSGVEPSSGIVVGRTVTSGYDSCYKIDLRPVSETMTQIREELHYRSSG